MKTIKLPINIEEGYESIINDYRRECSSIIRWSFNRFKDGLKRTPVYNKFKELNGFNLIKSHLLNSCIASGKGLYDALSDKDTKLIFREKSFNKRKKRIISKDEFKYEKLLNIYSIGEANKKGNRLFKLDIESNRIIFKPSKEYKINIILPKLRRNYRDILFELQILSELNKIPITFELNDKFIYITYDECDLTSSKPIIKSDSGNYVGIDMNPNFIGLSIFNENEEMIHHKLYDLSNLTIKSNKASNHKDSIYLDNKLDYETIMISKDIQKLCIKFNIKFMFIEDLKFNNKSKNKGFNRLTKCKWKRNLFINNLTWRLNYSGISIFKVNPSYTSIIGNLQYNIMDPIAASMEIARRGYNIIIKKNKKTYPDLKFSTLYLNQWKEEDIKGFKNWKDVSVFLKTSKLKYRRSLDEFNTRVFRLDSKKSKVLIYVSNDTYL